MYRKNRRNRVSGAVGFYAVIATVALVGLGSVISALRPKVHDPLPVTTTATPERPARAARVEPTPPVTAQTQPAIATHPRTRPLAEPVDLALTTAAQAEYEREMAQRNLEQAQAAAQSRYDQTDGRDAFARCERLRLDVEIKRDKGDAEALTEAARKYQAARMCYAADRNRWVSAQPCVANALAWVKYRVTMVQRVAERDRAFAAAWRQQQAEQAKVASAVTPAQADRQYSGYGQSGYSPGGYSSGGYGSSGTASVSGGSPGTVHVRGYTRKDGTYVAPHSRAAPGRGRK